MTARIDAARLLSESRWLSALARRLVTDGIDADDLAQETLLAALEREPDTRRSLRAWLATVLRTRLVDAKRARRARIVREELAARHEAEASTSDVVAKAELQRELVDALLELDEPFRTAVLLRFFENLPPREIARRTGVAVATVDSRIQRGLARLRERLDRERPRTSWLAALAPLAGDRVVPGNWIWRWTIVNGTTKTAITAAVIAIACIAWWRASRAAIEHPVDTGIAAESVEVARVEPTSVAGRAPSELERGERTSAATCGPSARVATPSTTAPVTRAMLRGRVRDVQGRGLAGVHLGCEPESGDAHAAVELGASGAGGYFELALPASATAITSIDPRWSTVLAGSARIQPDHESGVIVAPRLDLGGRVVDEHGAPIAGVELSAHVAQHLGADLGILLDYSVARAWRTRTDAMGAFVLADVPSVERATLRAAHAGFVTRVDALPLHSNASMELVLETPRETEKLLRGVVLDPGGAFVEGARVSAGNEVAISDAQGAFVLDVSDASLLPRLVAVARGFQPAVFEPERTGEVVHWPARVVLQLAGRSLAISGRVLDGHAKPFAGARVWIVDPSSVGQSDGDVLIAESFAASAADRKRPFWSYVLSDSDGRFELGGLADRAYTIAAMDPKTLARADAERVRAGEHDVELRLDGDLLERLKGRVVARDGTGVPGVSVKFQRPALEVKVPGGTRDEWADSDAVKTDADGAFELRDLPRTGVEVFAWGDTILFAGVMLEAKTDLDHFELHVDRRVHLQVELEQPDRADLLRVLGSDGQPMILRVMRGETSFTSRKSSIEDGRSQVLSLGEDARVLVLYKGDVEVGRVELRLDPKQANVVRW